MKIISHFIKKEENYRKYVNFECECGATGTIRADSTRKSGCPVCEPQVKHGMINSPEYTSWKGAKRRCFNPNAVGFALYGGSGITMCDRWADKKNGFANFLEDMGKKPDKHYSLDRVNPYGNYEPDNCRWATPETQSNNKRFFGKRVLCSVCDKAFLRGQRTNKYCSVSCRDFACRNPGKKRLNYTKPTKERTMKHCLVCKTEFLATYHQKYCCYLCGYTVQKEKAREKHRAQQAIKSPSST